MAGLGPNGLPPGVGIPSMTASNPVGQFRAFDHKIIKPDTQPNTNTGSWWPWWLGGSSAPKPVPYMRPSEAMMNHALRRHFIQLLDFTDPPKCFRCSAVAQQLTMPELAQMGYSSWEDCMPALVELAFEMRASGYCQVLLGKKVLPEDVDLYELHNEDLRVRRDESDV